jgi:hypothetical protein
MSTVPMTAPEAAATTPRARAPKTTIPTPRTAAGSTVAPGGPGRRRGLPRLVRNLGIALDTTARVVFLGRDGVQY